MNYPGLDASPFIARKRNLVDDVMNNLVKIRKIYFDCLFLFPDNLGKKYNEEIYMVEIHTLNFRKLYIEWVNGRRDLDDEDCNLILMLTYELYKMKLKSSEIYNKLNQDEMEILDNFVFAFDKPLSFNDVACDLMKKETFVKWSNYDTVIKYLIGLRPMDCTDTINEYSGYTNIVLKIPDTEVIDSL